jgi:hypothetical protein
LVRRARAWTTAACQSSVVRRDSRGLPSAVVQNVRGERLVGTKFSSRDSLCRQRRRQNVTIFLIWAPLNPSFYDVPPTPCTCRRPGRDGRTRREGHGGFRLRGCRAVRAGEEAAPLLRGLVEPVGRRRSGQSRSKPTSKASLTSHVPNSHSAHGRPWSRVRRPVPGFVSWRRGGLS